MRLACTLTAALIVFAASSFDGSTHHLAALGLRAFLCALVFYLSPTRRTDTLLTLALGLVMGISGTGLFWSERLPGGLSDWASLAGFCVILLVAQSANQIRCSTILDGMIAAASAQGAWALVQWLLGAERSSGGFFNPNNFGAWLLLVGTAAVLRRHALANAAAIICTIGVLLSGSRSAIFALVLVLVVLMAHRSTKAAAIAAVVSSLSLLAIPAFRRRVLGIHDHYAFDRIQIWSSALKAGWREPWGFGLGDARIAFRALGIPLAHGEVRFPKEATQAHSEWLQLWVELGWLGVFVLILYILVATVIVVGERNREETKTAAFGKAGTVALLLAIAVPASFGNTIRVPVIALCAGFILGMRASDLSTQPLDRSIRWPLLFAAASMVFLTAPASAGRVFSGLAATTRSEQLATARSWSAKAVDLAPHDIANHLLDASLEFKQTRDANLAIQRLEGISLRFPSNPAPLDRMGKVLRQLPASEPRDVQLYVLAQRRISIEPHNAFRWLELSRAASRQNQRQTQLGSLERAIELEPNFASALLELAELTQEPDAKAQLVARAIRANQRSSYYRGFAAAILSLTAKQRARAQRIIPKNFQIPSHALDSERL